MAAHQAGERWWLNDEEEARREALATRFVETDPWEDRVLEFALRQERVRTAEVLLQALEIPMGKLSRRDEMRVTGILKRAGFRPEQSRLDGKNTRYWVKSRRGSGRDGRDHD